MELIDLLIEFKKENENFFKQPPEYASLIKKRAQEILGKGTRVFLFGSIVKGNYTFGSDIDVLVVGSEVPPEKRGYVMAEIKKAVGLTSPFEIHLTTPKLYKNWYKKFIKKELLEI